MKSIRYVSYYADKENPQKRTSVLAATNKMGYICKALNGIGYDVTILSASITEDKKSHRGENRQLGEHLRLKSYFVMPWTNPLYKLISLASVRLGLFFDLMKVKKGEPVIVYHSLGYMRTVRLTHALKRYRLIMEAEEIYADVVRKPQKRPKEIAYLKTGDGFIFPTVMLNELLNEYKRPYAVIHGTYQVEPNREESVFDSNGKIHCVYAGTLDPRKGCLAAAQAGAFLPDNYHIHILGFGTSADKENVLQCVSKISDTAKAKVSYDGLLSGEEYIRFIQNCQIGLCTQDPTAAFTGTSFPSKVLSYLSNGLRVVSVRIPAIEQSAIGNEVSYYDEQTPEKIAEAVLRVDMTAPYDSRTVIAGLDKRFCENLESLLEKK